MCFEVPFVYKDATLKSLVEEMVEDINDNCASKEEFLEMEYNVGTFDGQEVLVVIRRKGGGSGLFLKKEPFVPYVDDM